jgi:hypothetical protein
MYGKRVCWEYKNEVRYLAAIFIQHNTSLQGEVKSEASGVTITCIEESFPHSVCGLQCTYSMQLVVCKQQSVSCLLILKFLC